MMCGGALLARPLSPLREALSATLTHLGGVLPPHLGYNPSTVSESPWGTVGWAGVAHACSGHGLGHRGRAVQWGAGRWAAQL